MFAAAILIAMGASWAYWLFAGWQVRKFWRSRQPADNRFRPPVSILKPVKGADAGAYQNFLSFCSQDYPDFEVLFGVRDPADPVVAVIKRLQRELPRIRIRLIVTAAGGANRKAAILDRLAAEARHEVLLVSDSDMRVTPDYLLRVAAPLQDEQVGLVTCLYQGKHAGSLAAVMELLHMGVTFLPSVLAARRLQGIRFATGATAVFRKRHLEQIGGFAAIADYLADDYQLGMRIAQLGLKVHLSDYITASILGPTSFQELWNREVRWARCIRISRPREYPGLLFTFSTPLAVVFALTVGFGIWGQAVLLLSLLLRWSTGWLITGATGDESARRNLIWLPLRDMLSALVWCAATFGRRIDWRGEVFVLQPGGRLRLAARSGRRLGGLIPALLDKVVRGFDRRLRRNHHVYEFSRDEKCLLRLSVKGSRGNVALSDGTLILKGEPVCDLHLWNENIPPIPQNGPNLAWALAFQRNMARSFRELAAHIQIDPDLRKVKAFRAENSFGGRRGIMPISDLAGRWGFEMVYEELPTGTWRDFIDFWRKFYMYALIWAFSSGPLNRSLTELRRGQLWLSKARLLERFAGERNPPVMVAGALRNPSIEPSMLQAGQNSGCR